MAAGLVEPARAGARDVGEVLARAAYLEEAAVAAFLDLAAQVEAHGAPAGLVKRLRRAAEDEVRHAGLYSECAARQGAKLPPIPDELKIKPIAEDQIAA